MPAFKSSSRFATVLLAVLSPLAVAAQPPNVVTSDVNANTAMGSNALLDLTSGIYNTAAGYDALFSTTSGVGNTAVGAYTMGSNTTGDLNSAYGYGALYNNTGDDNSAFGVDSLLYNSAGIRNSAVGRASLFTNTTGGDNVAMGAYALYFNTEGDRNAAFGTNAAYSGTTGVQNTALGSEALYGNATGYRNVAIGYRAGYSVRGKDNISIGALNFGKTTDNGVIRIGGTNQVKAYVAGISGVKTGAASAAAVFVDANGQLGTIKSSREYKEDIRPMGSASERLYALKPVTFHYKEAYDDGSKPIEFGLIAEDVALAFPELVVHDADGKPQTVRYDLVATLLLNEFQKAHGVIESQSAELRTQAASVEELRQQLAAMAEVIARLEQERRLTAAN